MNGLIMCTAVALNIFSAPAGNRWWARSPPINGFI